MDQDRGEGSSWRGGRRCGGGERQEPREEQGGIDGIRQAFQGRDEAEGFGACGVLGAYGERTQRKYPSKSKVYSLSEIGPGRGFSGVARIAIAGSLWWGRGLISSMLVLWKGRGGGGGVSLMT